eukprot:gnl/TRDRNA2_/TRDRNA2_158357_c0_seq2.p2 gnl/TRDRNA2_/TRDRNA2_158357_c0~~gnl/TRDRNA2_/TRDRNA2_158357_c0_seq2.p2  ORF type:complete len:127 (-),score=6.35 gnl/TRDRNA2_/TRDRNA2_158357_c0_seq2:178-558(-)
MFSSFTPKLAVTTTAPSKETHASRGLLITLAPSTPATAAGTSRASSRTVLTYLRGRLIISSGTIAPSTLITAAGILLATCPAVRTFPTRKLLSKHTSSADTRSRANEAHAQVPQLSRGAHTTARST